MLNQTSYAKSRFQLAACTSHYTCMHQSLQPGKTAKSDIPENCFFFWFFAQQHSFLVFGYFLFNFKTE